MLLGPLKFTTEQSQQFIDEIIEQYPSAIAEEFCKLKNGNYEGWDKKLLVIKNLQYKANRLAALITLSIYLKDEDLVDVSANLRKYVSELLMPSDSTWKNIVTSVLDEYTKRNIRFPVENLEEQVLTLSSNNHGYQNIIAGNLFEPQQVEASIFQAGISLRNAFHHYVNSNLLTETQTKQLFFFFQDIVLSLLKGFQFLNGTRYKLLTYDENSELFECLHGIKKKFLSINRPGEENEIYLYDTVKDTLHELYPMMLRLPEFWNDQKEFSFSNFVKSTAAHFDSRYTKTHIDEKDAVNTFHNLLSKKKLPLQVSLSKFNYRSLVSFSIETTQQTLNGYRHKYFAEAYVEKPDFLKKIREFLDGNQTAFFINGPAGIGKSALLAHIAATHLPSPNLYENYLEVEYIPIFISGRDTNSASAGGAPNPVFNFIKHSFLLSEGTNQFTQLAAKFDTEIRNNFFSNSKPPRVLLIIDAINESASPAEMFKEIHERIIRKCQTKEANNKYPWLKIIYSTRNFTYNDSQIFRNESVPDYSAYYTDTDKVQKNQPDYFVHDLQPFTPEETELVFKKYCALPKFTFIRQNPPSKVTLKGKQNALQKPLILWMYTLLLEEQKKQELSIGNDEGEILVLFYNHFKRYPGVEELLFCMAKLMIYNFHVADIPLNSELNERRLQLTQQWKTENRIDATELDPFQKMLHEGLLQVRFVDSGPGNPTEPYVTFTYQRFAEEVIYRYLKACFPNPTEQQVQNLFNTVSNFEEYNNALILYLQQLWQTEKWELLFDWKPNLHVSRHAKVLAETMTKEWNTLPGSYTEETKLQLEKYVQKLERWGVQKNRIRKNLLVIAELISVYKKLFDNVAFYQHFYKKLTGFCYSCFQAWNPDLETNNEILYGYSACLVRLGKFSEEEGKIEEAKEKYIEARKLCMKILKDLPNSSFYKIEYAITFSKLGGIYKKIGNLKNALRCYKKYNRLSIEVNSTNSKDSYYKGALAVSYSRLGDLNFLAQDWEVAKSNFSKANIIFLEISSDIPESLFYRTELAISYAKLGNVCMQTGDLQTAINYFFQEHDLASEAATNSPTNLYFKGALAASFSGLGTIYQYIGEIKQTLKCSQENHRLVMDMYIADPENLTHKKLLADSYANFGRTFEEMGDITQALKNHKRCLEIVLEICSDSPNDVNLKFSLFTAYSKLAGIYNILNDNFNTIKNYKESRRLIGLMCDAYPLNRTYKAGLAIVHMQLGLFWIKIDDWERALSDFNLNLKLSIELYSLHNTNANKNSLITSHSNIARVYNALGKPEKALNHYLKANKHAVELHKLDSDSLNYKNNLSLSYSNLGTTYKNMGELSKALESFKERQKLILEICTANPQNLSFRNGLALSHLKLGIIYQTIGEVENAILNYKFYNKLTAELFTIDPDNKTYKKNLTASFQQLCDIYEAEGELDLAVNSYQERIKTAIITSTANPNNPTHKKETAVSYYHLGTFLRHYKMMGQAIENLEKAKEIFSDVIDALPKDEEINLILIQIYYYLGHMYHDVYKSYSSSQQGEIGVNKELAIKSLNSGMKYISSIKDTVRSNLVQTFFRLIREELESIE